MNKCPKCKSANIVDQGLTYSANPKNSQKSLFKCNDCNKVFHSTNDEKEQQEKSKK